MKVDLVLSSGFLAFARHAGFLRAIEASALQVEGLCGTSSGALVAALWAAGLSADEIARELSAQRPISAVRPSLVPWRGLCSLAPFIARLEGMLPATFGALGRPFAVGVSAPDRGHRLLTEGPLPAAVAASCAVPYLFAPVAVDGVRYQDGGAVDRLGLSAWRRWRGARRTVVHLIERTYGASTDGALDDALVIRSAPSGASLWSLGDFAAQLEESAAAAGSALRDGLASAPR